MSLQESNHLHYLVTHVPVDIACEIIHRSRSFVFELLGKGKLTAVKDGNRSLISVESIRAYQASMPPAVFKVPPPPRMDGLVRLREKVAAERAARRRARRRGE